MHIKVDEDLPRSCIELLRAKGYAATSVVEQGLQGAKDPTLWQTVQQHGYFFVTADKGFGDIRIYPPGKHEGVLLLRPAREGAIAYAELLRSVVEAVDLAALRGTLAVASPHGLRIRRG